MQMKAKWAVCLALASGVLLAHGCASSNRICNDAGSLINQGKTKLSLGTDGDYVSAAVYFQDAINKGCGLNVDEAKFGFVIAYFLHQISAALASIKIPQDPVAGLSPDVLAGLRALQAGSGLNPVIDTLVNDFILQTTATLEPILLQIERNPNFSFRIPSLPISIDLTAIGLGNESIGNLGGNYTLTEVDAFYSFLKLLDGMGAMVQSIDFSLNVGAVQAGFSKGIFDVSFSLSNSARDLSSIVGLLAFTLNSSPNFLGLRPGTGVAASQSAATSFSQSVGALLAGLQFAENRFLNGTAQPDDVVSYKYDSMKKTEQLTIHLKGISGTLCSPFGNGGGDNLVIPIGTKTGNNSGITSALQNIQKGFITPGVRISWASDLAPLLSIGAYAFIHSSLYDKILPPAATWVSPSILDFIKNYICSPIDFIPTPFPLFLETIIPDVAQFDLGTAFQNPKGIREILPAWSCPNCPGGDFINHPENATGTLLLEYECSRNDLDPKFFGFVCAATAPSLLDADNFVGPPTFAVSPNLCSSANPHCVPPSFFISKDGTDSQFPYIPFIDPTFNGSLYINLSNCADDVLPPLICAQNLACTELLDGTQDVNGFQPANQKGLNDAIMLIGKNISSLLNTQLGGGAPRQ